MCPRSSDITVLEQSTTPTRYCYTSFLVKAELLLHERHQIDTHAFAEIKVWRVPGPVRASEHQYKYSLAYVEKGDCVLRYDNEAGKGDHFHKEGEDLRYTFTTVEKLLADFWSAIDEWRSK
ncbi:MAG TPA: DUF6516 family protein [Candidatus Binatia bacterium]|nr:DUF6516 family protein [Candidatus Binatia bacterium]